ncbi:MAG: hypothetical protein IT453_20800 [Planctomycetes bacterium]|nr:hypothetical protein [Planctomycetota bacterium]
MNADATAFVLALVFGCRQESPPVGDVPAPFEAAQDAEVLAAHADRLARIQAELAQSAPTPDDWFGYYTGLRTKEDSESFAYARESGCVWKLCDGESGSNSGRVLREEDDGLDVEWIVDPMRSTCWQTPWGEPQLSSRLVKVHWGELKFLIQRERMRSFCNDVNSGLVRAGREYPCRTGVGASDQVPAGIPLVPAEYRDWLLETPVESTISEVRELPLVATSERADRYVKQVQATVPVGSAQRVSMGMALHLIPDGEEHWSDAAGWDGRVVQVERDRAVVEFRRAADLWEPTKAMFRVGRRVSTRAPLPAGNH